MRINSDEIHIVMHIEFQLYYYALCIYPQIVELILKPLISKPFNKITSSCKMAISAIDPLKKL
jgi:hypothetical protein